MSACFNDESRRHKRARYIRVRMRIVFRHDGGSENRKTGGTAARRARTGITHWPSCEIPFGASHVSKRSRRQSRISSWRMQQ